MLRGVVVLRVPKTEAALKAMYPRCVICGGREVKATHWNDIFGTGCSLVECTTCGVRFYDKPMLADPVGFYSTDAYDDYIRRHVEYGSPFLREFDQAEYDRYTRTRGRTYTKMIDLLRSNMARPLESLYEVGASWGLFLEVAQANGIKDVAGCDLSRAGAAKAKERGFDVEHAAFLEARPPDQVDAVVSSDVIEHTPTPGADLARAFVLTRPGGGLCLKTFYDEWHDTRELDLSPRNKGAEHGYLTAGYFGSSHLVHFSTAALVGAIERVGYVVKFVRHHETCGQVDVYAVKP